MGFSLCWCPHISEIVVCLRNSTEKKPHTIITSWTRKVIVLGVGPFLNPFTLIISETIRTRLNLFEKCRQETSQGIQIKNPIKIGLKIEKKTLIVGPILALLYLENCKTYINLLSYYIKRIS